MSIDRQYRQVVAEVEEVCRACGRDPREVRLIAVSKTVGVERVAEAIGAGALDFGENRPDQIMDKYDAYPHVNWHFIGNIQSRRIPDIVRCATLIHSVYQEHHLSKIDAAAADLGKVQDILIEVNVSGEQSKSGATRDEAFDLVRGASRYPHIRVRGLMTMAPQGDADAVRDCFAGLAQLRSDIRHDAGIMADNVSFSELSMGMSEDWRCAVSQGATMVRIGRAIFSEDFTR